MPVTLERLDDYLDRIESAIPKAPTREQLAEALDVSPRMLRRVGYTKDRVYLLHLGILRVGKLDPFTGFWTFRAEPQVPFRPWRLVISMWSEMVAAFGVLNNWLVRDIKVANSSQFVQGSNQGFPASAFLPKASQVLFKFDTCDVGKEITVEMEQIDPANFPDETAVITAGMVGFAADR